MKSVLGPNISQGAGILGFSTNINDANKIQLLGKKLYPDFNVIILDLSNPDQRITAINIDPDIADFKSGYVVAISILA
ncbi:hypothetical protein [Acidianus brierleyi]|uniref:Uncharacterized protein n=1 Tax=Acidianus brierleyi TaxID=41673 RepID=A0A2U9IE44_9CREN|nr:hypothetical protein [Acidianus brierleyi]AWR94317.1 hypothetical protein DFR85_06625 [Acidianus brierleyi]